MVPVLGEKEDAMVADVAAITFAMLIYDEYLDEDTRTWQADEGQATIGVIKTNLFHRPCFADN